MIPITALDLFTPLRWRRALLPAASGTIRLAARLRSLLFSSLRHETVSGYDTSLQSAPSTSTSDSKKHDRSRQVLNLVLAVAQVAAAAWSVTTGLGPDADGRVVSEPPVVPALYTFSVWSVIYAGSLIYAVYQALPAQRENPLLRRVGRWTVGAFLATTLWTVAAGLGWDWLTVPIMFAMFVALLGAFIGFSRDRSPRTAVERLLVVLPLSIFLGYVTVATVANPASVLKQSGVVSPLGLPETAWAVLMTLAAGLIASFVIVWSRGNVGYALTIVWALIGIIVANVVDVPNLLVAFTAGGMSGVVVLALAYALVTKANDPLTTEHR